ncbi:serine/threonine protein kinase, CMGC, dual-specificity [Elasticomyces elasticus]|nr:serine/threonine protein kinase, CMGC, dual-specificity [Elasticomyces elasticus]
MGRLWLSARHNCVALDGIPLQRGEGRILQHQARIEIGQLRFLFQFIIPKEQEAVFRDALRDYLSSHRDVEAPHELTSATPSANDVNIGDWRLHGIVGATPLSIIEAASNMRTGEAVAVKRLLRRPNNAKKVDEELNIYESLQAIRKHRYGSFAMKKHSVLAGKTASSNVEDALLGLQALHDISWIHRDLKPANIAIVSLKPPHAILIDFGQATINKAPGYPAKAGVCGTIGFLAPELENPLYAASYGQKVDVWSMGAVGVYMLDLGRIPWSTTHNMFVPDRNAKDPSLSVFRDYLEILGKKPSDSLDGLLYQMLQERPEFRVDIHRALSHACLQKPFAAANAWVSALAKSGSKRSHE